MSEYTKNNNEPAALREEDWRDLLESIHYGKCTPFLGAGVCHGVVPLAAEIAEAWALEHRYPLDDHRDLARVAQFLATEFSPLFPKRAIASSIEKLEPPNFHEPDEPHGVLADLPLPVYITTNYDNFMFRALLSRSKRPRLEVCQWNPLLKGDTSHRKPQFEPTKEEPLVYHLHGWSKIPESIVLSEDDYLDFLVNLWKEKPIPHRVKRSMSNSSLLFLGYRLADWDFRVLFRSLVSYLPKNVAHSHVSVQLVPIAPGAQPEQKHRVKQYLDRYFGKMEIRVYWGTCRAFVSELRDRWNAFPRH